MKFRITPNEIRHQPRTRIALALEPRRRQMPLGGPTRYLTTSLPIALLPRAEISPYRTSDRAESSVSSRTPAIMSEYSKATHHREGGMARPRTHQSSADVDAQIRRLEQEKQRLVVEEDQRRGAVIRDCLTSPIADSLREMLQPVVSSRDAALFGIQTSRTRPTPSAPGKDLAPRHPRAAAPSKGAEPAELTAL